MNIYVLTVFFACGSVVASCNKPYYPANLLGEWSDWSECSATCDQGTQQRKRECNGAPEDCDGDLEEERACPDLPRCKGTLGQWSQWSECSATCGEGRQTRQRRCIGPGDCDVALIDEEPCQDQPNCIGNIFFLSTLC